MNLLNEGCLTNPPAQNQPFFSYSSQFASMTPEQFQQHQQEQQQAFFRWQQSQVLNREFQDLQQHPPSFNSENSQSLTQPQQVDSPKKGGRKKTKSKRGKNVEDEPVAAGRWLPVEEELLATCYVAVSEDNNVTFCQEDVWAILKFHPKWDAPEQVDLTGDVPGATQEDLFGHDARPRPAGKPRPAKKTKSDDTASTGGSSASTQFGELMEQELPGANNDINVLDNSPLFDDLLDDLAPAVPYVVNGVEYRNGYYLADGIYPEWASSVKSFTVATDPKHTYFKQRQDSARKDVERAFGVLQGRWGLIQQPAYKV
nr:protein ALP1-like isoform X1 [Tanacetum cinerariifolium]